MKQDAKSVNFKEKYVAYIDILGFKSLTRAAEEGNKLSLDELLLIIQELTNKKQIDFYQHHGPEVCPNSPHCKKDLDFRVTQISDCVIASCEVTDCAFINLVHYCRIIILRLVKRGILCRGYIGLGSIFHEESQVIGSGYINAFSKEAGVKIFQSDGGDIGTPFVELDKSIVDRISDKCSKEILHREFLMTDGNFYAISPFRVLDPWRFVMGPMGSLDKDLNSINITRNNIKQLKSGLDQFSDPDDLRSKPKIGHIKTQLDLWLNQCDRAEETVRSMYGPLLRR